MHSFGNTSSSQTQEYHGWSRVSVLNVEALKLLNYVSGTGCHKRGPMSADDDMENDLRMVWWESERG